MCMRLRSVNPEANDHLAEIFANLAACVVRGHRGEADQVARSIAVKPLDVMRRPTPPPLLFARVFLRDSFTCRYCAASTIAPPVLRVIGSLYPAELPSSGPRHKTHEVNWTLYATLDHVEPGSTGGD